MKTVHGFSWVSYNLDNIYFKGIYAFNIIHYASVYIDWFPIFLVGKQVPGDPTNYGEVPK